MKMESLFANKPRIYIFIHLWIVVAVIFLFKIVPDKKIASVIAGLLFLLGPALVLFMEWKTNRGRSFSFIGSLAFLLSSALPIFFLRVLNWQTEFRDTQLMGISGEQLHKFSNYSFMILLLCFFVDSLRRRLQEKQKAT